jgi:hypothetical protein
MCENCKERAENPAQYKLRMAWLEHCHAEEMHERYARSNTALNDGTSGYHREMQGYHKARRLQLEKKMRG